MTKSTTLILLFSAILAINCSLEERPTLQIQEEDATLIVQGLLDGLLSSEYPDLDACLKHPEQIGGYVIDAVKDFQRKSFDGVKDGMAHIGQAISLVPGMMSDCDDVDDDLRDLQKVAEMFKHPWSLSYKIGKGLVVNGVDVYNQLKDGISAY